MTTTQRPRPRRSAPPPGPNPANRGLILVILGIALGAILLVKAGGVGFDSDSTNIEVGSGDEAGQQAGSSTTTTVAATTTVAPASVKVVAANASGVKGLAAETTQFLAQSGYTTTVAANAVNNTTTSTVYWAPGFEPSAKAIAELLGVPEAQVQALPVGAKLADNQPADTAVLILVGPDLQAAVTGGGTSTTAAGGGTGTTIAGGSTTTIAGTSGTGSVTTTTG